MDNGECSKRGLVTRCNFRHVGPEMVREYLLPLPYRHVTDESRKAIPNISLQTQWTVHSAKLIKYDAHSPLHKGRIIKNQIASLPHSFLWAAPTSHGRLHASSCLRSCDFDTAREHQRRAACSFGSTSSSHAITRWRNQVRASMNWVLLFS